MLDIEATGRVLYISSVDISVGNGPGVNEREFLVALHSRLGGRAHFLIPRPSGYVGDVPAKHCTFCKPHNNHAVWHFPQHLASQVRLARRLLAQQRWDLLIFRLDLLPIAPLLITRTTDVPYVIKTLGQGTMNTLRERVGWLGRPINLVNRRLIRRLVTGALATDAVSQLQVDLLRKLLKPEPGTIDRIDNGVNTQRFAPMNTPSVRHQLGLTRFEQIVGYVGTRPWERGGDALVEAAPRLVHTHPTLGFVVLGDGVGLGTLQRRARELGVEDRFVFAGHVALDEVPCFDVGVSISTRWDRRAAAELKVRQYLACGKPVVASPGSNQFLTEQQLGSVVQANDSASTARAIDRWLVLDTMERRAFERRAVDYVERRLSMRAVMSQRWTLWSQRLQESAS